MNILGISALYHDSAACLIQDGIIVAAVQEERFTRKKNDESFPVNAIRYCLEHAAIHIDDLDAVVFYDKPLLKFERLLETYYAFAPHGFASFLRSMPIWMREKLFLRKLVLDGLKTVEKFNKRNLKLLFTEHHLSHAASAYYPSPFENAAILTIDGVGEWATASICKGEGKDITILKEMRFPHSLGLLYSAFTYFLGFRVNSGEYKLMGLAPYGNPESEEVTRLVRLIKKHLVDLKEDGSIWLNQEYFSYATGLRMVDDKKWEKLFGFPKRASEAKLEQHHCNLGLAIQQVTEEAVLRMAKHTKEITGSNNLCLAGGVALNCVANGKLVNANLFKNVFIQPAAGDAGGALGAALAVYHIHFKKERTSIEPDALNGSYLGPEFSSKQARTELKCFNPVCREFDSHDTLCEQVADLISNGKVVGWMQGRMEFGPRALGARSILGNPCDPTMQKRLNLKIKYRESFRPFAPSVLREDNAQLFNHDGDSPYMLVVKPVSPKLRNPLPEGYSELDIKDKLYFERSKLPAVTHVDYSARIQTVDREINPVYWRLINAVKKKTGFGAVVNTSFNVRGEPIVCTPTDAYRCFMRTEMDYLVIDTLLFAKEDQPKWQEKREWKGEFILD